MIKCTDSTLEKELAELGSQFGKFLDRQGERASRKFDQLRNRLDDALMSVADVIDAELDAAEARKSEAQREQERLNKEKLDRLKFGTPIRAYGRDGFYVGPRDPNSEIFKNDYQVALQAPNGGYVTYVGLNMIEPRD
jgi:ElaB/YqjD/DUF883 family membrane-anchored ribosome-binding protein